MNKKSEQELIEGLKKGDEFAYKRIYILYYSELCIYLNTICSNIEVSKDLSQQVFIKIWKKRESISINYSLKKYIFKIGYNLFKDLQRKKEKDINLIERLKYEAVNELIEVPEDDFEAKLNMLLSEVDKLPKKCKTVFLLAKKDGLKYQEISEELNISVKTVERHMTKALKRIRKTLS